MILSEVFNQAFTYLKFLNFCRNIFLGFSQRHEDVSRSGESRYKYQYFLVHSLEILELLKVGKQQGAICFFVNPVRRSLGGKT